MLGILLLQSLKIVTYSLWDKVRTTFGPIFGFWVKMDHPTVKGLNKLDVAKLYTCIIDHIAFENCNI